MQPNLALVRPAQIGAQIAVPVGILHDVLVGADDFDHASHSLRVAELAALHAQVPLLHVLPAHQRTAWAETFGTPGACVE